MKIIFLDIDGVLNSLPDNDTINLWKKTFGEKETERKLYGLDSELVKNLKEIIDKTGCKIVFSTSWRYFKDHHIEGDDWRKTLQEMLHVNNDTFLGDTPILWNCDDYGFKRIRGTEIKTWLMNNTTPGSYTYCIIDDVICDIKTVIPIKNIVHINPKTGLQKTDIERCINVLN